VEAFLDGELSYLGIAKLVERVMEMHVTHAIETIENVMEADEWARRTARDVIGRQDMEAG
jgi:1-deoxy-D-xylulose-5-phosphate reductoisomerase